MTYHHLTGKVSRRWLAAAASILNGQESPNELIDDELVWLPYESGWVIKRGNSALIPPSAELSGWKALEIDLFGYEPEDWQGFVWRLQDGSTFVAIPSGNGAYEICFTAPPRAAKQYLVALSAGETTWSTVKKLPAGFRREWFFDRPWEGGTSDLEPDHVWFLLTTARKAVVKLPWKEMDSATTGAICRAFGLPASTGDDFRGDPIVSAAMNGFGSALFEKVLYEIDGRGGLIIPEPIPQKLLPSRGWLS
jgi:hypothetical protein